MKKGAEAPFFNDLQTPVEVCGSKFGAGNETRTRDPDLGKVVLYQLSYSRITISRYSTCRLNYKNFIGTGSALYEKFRF